MKLTREITGAINRRAYALAQEAMQTFAATMKAEAERGALRVEDVAGWVPIDRKVNEFGLIVPTPEELCEAAENVRRAAEKVSDSLELAPGGDTYVWNGSTNDLDWLREAIDCFHGLHFRLPAEAALKPGRADPGFDATDHLAGF